MKIIRIAGIIIAVLVILIIAAPLFIDVNQFRPTLESRLSTALGRPVSVGNLKLGLRHGTLTATDLSVGDDPAFSKSPFLQAKSLDVAVEMMPLITSRKVNVTGITVREPQISLLQNAQGNWNYSTLGNTNKTDEKSAPASGSSSNLDLSVKVLKISDGRLTVAKTSEHGKPMVLDKVQIELDDFAPGSVMPFSFSGKLNGGGDVKLDGKVGPINQGNAEATPLNASLKASHVDLLASGLVDASTGFSGIAGLDGTAQSDGKEFIAKGRAHAEQVKLVKGGSPAGRPLEFDFGMRHNLATRTGSLTQGDVHIGSAKASLTGTYAMHGESVALKANLVGDQMPVQELESVLPALNIVLPAGSKLDGGTAVAKLNIDGPVENLVSTGNLGINNVKLVGFDLGGKLAVIQALAGMKSNPTTTIQVLSANVKNSNEGTAIDNLKLVATDIGEITGSGTVSPNKALDFKMRIAVTSGFVPAALGTHAQAGIPFFIRGTAQDPKFEPDVKGLAAAELNDAKGSAIKAAGGLLDNLLNKKKQ